MLGLLAIAGLAWGFARVLDAPRWTGPAIALATVLVMMGGLLFLPPEAPFRQSVAGSVRTLLLVGALAVPVLGYRALLARVRQRAAPPPPAHPTGFVVVADDAALVADIAARAGAAPPRRLSVAHRGPDGAVTAAGRVTLDSDLAILSGLWVDAPARSRGLGGALVRHLEDEARRLGARRALADCGSEAAAGFLSRLGYEEAGRVAAREGLRITMTRGIA